MLPEEWPLEEIDPRDTPPPVPNLDSRPPVVPIDVRRRLFVDDFLVETSGLTRAFHLPVRYAGNPVLKPETELEINAPHNAAAVPKSGGVWWDPARARRGVAGKNAGDCASVGVAGCVLP